MRQMNLRIGMKNSGLNQIRSIRQMRFLRLKLPNIPNLNGNTGMNVEIWFHADLLTIN